MLEDRTLPTVTLGGLMDQHNLVGDSPVNSFMGSDSLGNPLSYASTGQPAGLSVNSSGYTTGTIANNASLTTPYYTTITATDTVTNESASASFNWYVSYQPAVTNQYLSDLHDQPLTIDLSNSVTNPIGVDLQFNTPMGGPANGTLVSNGDGHSYTYTPTAGFTGYDSFEITATYGSNTSNWASVNITVTNTAPTVSLPPARQTPSPP